MLTKLNNASLHLEYLVTPDFIVLGQCQKKKYHCPTLVSVLCDIKTTFKKMKLNILFSEEGGDYKSLIKYWCKIYWTELKIVHYWNCNYLTASKKSWYNYVHKVWKRNLKKFKKRLKDV